MEAILDVLATNFSCFMCAYLGEVRLVVQKQISKIRRGRMGKSEEAKSRKSATVCLRK
jgi:hypothetical protein